MHKAVLIKTYKTLPAYDRREILRYAGARGDESGEVQALLDECLAECDGVFSYRVCYVTLTRAEFFEIFPQSETAKTWTEDCENVTVFAATVGLGIDRLINRYASVSTAKALLFQTIGAERIERLCDVFCNEFCNGFCAEQNEGNKRTQKRFSPGYGDFPLTAQKEMFALLNPSKHIGVALTESFLMSPTKSVTAAFGIKDGGEIEKVQKNCAVCGKEDCSFKRE